MERVPFTGKPLDSTTGLYYFGIRYYDPEMGRYKNRYRFRRQGGIILPEQVCA